MAQISIIQKSDITKTFEGWAKVQKLSFWG